MKTFLLLSFVLFSLSFVSGIEFADTGDYCVDVSKKDNAFTQFIIPFKDDYYFLDNPAAGPHNYLNSGNLKLTFDSCVQTLNNFDTCRFPVSLISPLFLKDYYSGKKVTIQPTSQFLDSSKEIFITDGNSRAFITWIYSQKNQDVTISFMHSFQLTAFFGNSCGITNVKNCYPELIKRSSNGGTSTLSLPIHTGWNVLLLFLDVQENNLYYLKYYPPEIQRLSSNPSLALFSTPQKGVAPRPNSEAVCTSEGWKVLGQAVSVEQTCDDMIDNDKDGVTDCGDVDCGLEDYCSFGLNKVMIKEQGPVSDDIHWYGHSGMTGSDVCQAIYSTSCTGIERYNGGSFTPVVAFDCSTPFGDYSSTLVEYNSPLFAQCSLSFSYFQFSFSPFVLDALQDLDSSQSGTGQPGDSCATSEDCELTACVNNVCAPLQGTGIPGTGCVDDISCVAQTYCGKTVSGSCGGIFGACIKPGDLCQSGICVSSDSYCQAKKESYASCTAPSQCLSAICSGVCVPGIGDVCTANAQCSTKYCNKAVAGGICTLAQGTVPLSGECHADTECQSAYCNAQDTCDVYPLKKEGALCGATSECAVSLQCLDHVCTSVSGKEDPGAQNVCQPSCDVGMGCSQHVCTNLPSCSLDVDCEKGLVCYIEKNQCVGIPALCEPACSQGKACVSGTCETLQPCSSQKTCPSLDLFCAPDSFCHPFQEPYSVSLGGFCSLSVECMKGHFCEKHVCREIVSGKKAADQGGACQVQNDCGPYTLCHNNICIPQDQGSSCKDAQQDACGPLLQCQTNVCTSPDGVLVIDGQVVDPALCTGVDTDGDGYVGACDACPTSSQAELEKIIDTYNCGSLSNLDKECTIQFGCIVNTPKGLDQKKNKISCQQAGGIICGAGETCATSAILYTAGDVQCCSQGQPLQMVCQKTAGVSLFGGQNALPFSSACYDADGDGHGIKYLCPTSTADKNLCQEVSCTVVPSQYADGEVLGFYGTFSVFLTLAVLGNFYFFKRKL